MKQLLLTAIQASIDAGKEILKVYQTDDFQVTTKDDKSPLTIADQKSNNKIMEYLQKIDIHILSEEGKEIPYETRKNWKRFWLIDPLDGTKEFIKKNGEFTVNIALIENNKPIMGVIYVPISGELYFGEKNFGAYKIMWSAKKTEKFDEIILSNVMQNENKLPYKFAESKYTAVGSRSHKSAETEEYFEKLKNKHGEIEIISKGSSLKLCMVAEGKANIYPRLGPTMEWDTAAGHAIALAANCSVTIAYTNKELEYNKEKLLNPYFVVEKK